MKPCPHVILNGTPATELSSVQLQNLHLDVSTTGSCIYRTSFFSTDVSDNLKTPPSSHDFELEPTHAQTRRGHTKPVLGRGTGGAPRVDRHVVGSLTYVFAFVLVSSLPPGYVFDRPTWLVFCDLSSSMLLLLVIFFFFSFFGFSFLALCPKLPSVPSGAVCPAWCLYLLDEDPISDCR
jgi:hypothetical protein